MHYSEHKAEANKEGSSFSFMDFLSMHYGFASDHAQTPHGDTQLPMYKHLSTGLTFIMPALFVFSFALNPEQPCMPGYYLESYFYQYSITFLQPPRA